MHLPLIILLDRDASPPLRLATHLIQLLSQNQHHHLTTYPLLLLHLQTLKMSAAPSLFLLLRIEPNVTDFLLEFVMNLQLICCYQCCLHLPHVYLSLPPHGVWPLDLKSNIIYLHYDHQDCWLHLHQIFFIILHYFLISYILIKRKGWNFRISVYELWINII